MLQTVGQLSPIGSYFSNNTTVVQGFHQPFLKTKNTVELINNENIIAFPNPLEKDSVKIPISVADNQSNANAILFPIWLSSGTYDIYAYNGTASLFHISIIEFNIIQ
ncbi:MAG: hypothetical protein ISQ42_04485 [Flavobacteriaceae bacterium]|nr:hypothetical protein [Flavobacteriaceae bacterium]